MVGTMESLVKLTKKCITIVLRDRTLSEETLQTFLTEVESILNCRPLTHISNDTEDLDPLTPNHFLIGRPSPNINILGSPDVYINNRVKWKSLQAVTNMFWNRFIREYIPTLTVRKKWNNQHRNFTVGDMVLLSTNNFE